mmetsp:Transcript_67104/g.108792  ORF Transcript_67104/g.108792 Transcript_67104/m.108792 type:complete len:120 (+) Transcript_67104:2770-3129(+)
MKLHVSQADVCNKKKYEANDLKPGLFLAYCHSCRLCVGWSFLDEAETVRTCYNVFKHRNFAPGWEPPDAFDKNFAEMHSRAWQHDENSTTLSASRSDRDDGSEDMSEKEASCSSNDTSD